MFRPLKEKLEEGKEALSVIYKTYPEINPVTLEKILEIANKIV